MNYIKLKTKFVEDGSMTGIKCRVEGLGQIATIQRTYSDSKERRGPNNESYYVFPYQTAPCVDGKFFYSLPGAEAYVLSLAYEMHFLGKRNNK